MKTALVQLQAQRGKRSRQNPRGPASRGERFTLLKVRWETTEGCSVLEQCLLILIFISSKSSFLFAHMHTKHILFKVKAGGQASLPYDEEGRRASQHWVCCPGWPAQWSTKGHGHNRGLSEEWPLQQTRVTRKAGQGWTWRQRVWERCKMQFWAWDVWNTCKKSKAKRIRKIDDNWIYHFKAQIKGPSWRAHVMWVTSFIKYVPVS